MLRYAQLTWFLLALPSSGAGAASPAIRPVPLQVQAKWTAPLKEISGLKIFKDELFLASDHDLNLGRYVWGSKASGSKRINPSASTQTLSMTGLELSEVSNKKGKKAKKSQWEALTLDGAGNLFLLQESQDSLVQFLPNGQGARQWKLQAFDGRSRQNKGFEGLALMKSSHVLVALTYPPILVEYGPETDKPLGISKDTLLGPTEEYKQSRARELKPLKSWKLAGETGCEFADLAIAPSKVVYALLKDCNRIIELPELATSREEFYPVRTWTVPQSIDHPEGLEVVDNDEFLVAIDQKNVTENLFWLLPEPSLKK